MNLIIFIVGFSLIPQKLQFYHFAFKKKMLYLVIILVLTSNAYCYSVQGNWSLTSGQGITINEPVVLGITDFIYQKQQILQKLTFLGCQQLLLQAQFSQNQLFINQDTYFTSPLPNVACGQQNTLNQVYQSLPSVFFFQINIDQLLFNDPYGNNILSFRRLVNNSVNITGIRNMNQYGNKKTSLSVQISDKQITLCQGNLIYNYFIQSQNVITFSPVLESCPSKDLVAAFQSTTFFHANNGILGLYDKTVSLVVQLVYSTAFDPAKPIFGSQPQPQPTPAPQVSAVTAPSIVGQWSIKSLFDIALPKTSYSIQITSSKIQLLGGCNTYNYDYSLNSNTQVINIGSFSSTQKACGNSDDQLYVNGINKIYKYIYNNASGVARLNFYDQAGNIGYALQNTKNSPNNLPKSIPSSSPSQSLPLSAGNYLLLILLRRDLPRVIVTISGNTISYKACNSIMHTFSPTQLTSPKSSITITGGATSNNNCAVNNDLAYFGTLNQAKTYSYDANAGTVIFSNADGSEIATLNTAN